MMTTMSAHEPGEDQALVASVRDGDQRAREVLGQRVGHAAFIFALQLAGDRDAALDIAQDGVLKFFRNLDRFDENRSIEPWLYQIVRNRVRDLARRNQLRRHESIDAWLEQGHPEAADTTDSAGDPAIEAERTELQRRIWRSVALLSDAQREIFVLRDFHGLSYSEIAEVLSIPQGTVMSRLHAARTSLRTLLTNDETNDERSDR